MEGGGCPASAAFSIASTDLDVRGGIAGQLIV